MTFGMKTALATTYCIPTTFQPHTSYIPATCQPHTDHIHLPIGQVCLVTFPWPLKSGHPDRLHQGGGIEQREPREYQPHTDHIPATYYPLTRHIPTTCCTSHILTTYHPHTHHTPATYRPHADQINSFTIAVTLLWPYSKQDILIDCTKAVTSISVNPVRPYHLAIGCEDSTVRVFDRRAMSTDARATRTDSARLSGMFCQFRPEALAHRSCRVTSLQYR